MATVNIDVKGLREFSEKARRAAGKGFEDFCEQLLDDIGWEILAVFQEEVQKSGSIDTGKMFDSFYPGAEDNYWELDLEGLKITVGTNVDYAKFVNDGHWMNPQGVERRWVPGYWEGSHFNYVPFSNQGMSVRQQWIEGKHFKESAIRALEIMLPGYLKNKLNEWLRATFGG